MRLIVKASLKFGQIETEGVAQKAKIRCTIEGDEIAKYFHGILNRKT